jgi:hypothetical protein
VQGDGDRRHVVALGERVADRQQPDLRPHLQRTEARPVDQQVEALDLGARDPVLEPERRRLVADGERHPRLEPRPPASEAADRVRLQLAERAEVARPMDEGGGVEHVQQPTCLRGE